MSIFNNLNSREIIKYIREHGEVTADQLPLDLSIRKKSALLKNLEQLNVLNKVKEGRTWKYSIAFIYKERFDWE